MLSLTDRAAAAIQVLTSRSELPQDTAGLRIVAVDLSNNGNQD